MNIRKRYSGELGLRQLEPVGNECGELVSSAEYAVVRDPVGFCAQGRQRHIDFDRGLRA